MEQLRLLGQVALAMVLGGVIGAEREIADKPAGFRTHMLVAGMAAFLVGLGHALVDAYALETSDSVLRADPIRIVEAIVTGISFLGAGTIIRRGQDGVEGLTTAASILMTAAVGVGVALERYQVAVGVTLVALVILRVAVLVEGRLARFRHPEKPSSPDAGS